MNLKESTFEHVAENCPNLRVVTAHLGGAVTPLAKLHFLERLDCTSGQLTDAAVAALIQSRSIRLWGRSSRLICPFKLR